MTLKTIKNTPPPSAAHPQLLSITRAPLHIDYIGPPLTKPLTVRVTSDNTDLKVSPPTCTFTKKDDDCRLIVQLKNQGQKVYGVNQFTVTEAVEGAQGVVNPQAASDTSTVGFGVGVQGKDMPKPIPWETGWTQNQNKGTVIIANRTSQRRDYQSPFSTFSYSDFERISPIYTLDPGRICYLDQSIGRDYPNYTGYAYYRLSVSLNDTYGKSRYVSDVTDPHAPIYNGAFATPYNNITTCSANGTSECASNKWDSWTVALANLSGKDLDSNVFKAGQIQVLQNNTWGNGTTLYYKGDWNRYGVGLILIQGSVDGSRFDPNAAAPSILEIQSAPPCSDYTTDPSVTFTVRLKIFGPGTITMPAGAQCQKYNTRGEDFTYCTGSGSRNSWYEMTAVPEAGKTFKGWGSDGLCDDSKTTCRFPLTQNVSLKPFFW
jgi:hypothetical protein